MKYCYRYFYNSFLYILLTFSALSLFSCSTNRRISYFKDVPDSTNQNAYMKGIYKYKDPIIQPNDILQISIQTLDPQTSTLMGLSSTSSFLTQGSQASSLVQGYLVDKYGIIDLPLVGKMKISGMTTGEARDSIALKASFFYKDPVVNVRFANFNITILGEVMRPGQYTVANEKVSILDAIGMAGDLTVYGRRENVLLVREINEKKVFIRFDLNSSNIFQSPYFYLKQGDFLYVEPNRYKVVATDAVTTRNLTLISLSITLLVAIATLSRTF